MQGGVDAQQNGDTPHKAWQVNAVVRRWRGVGCRQGATVACTGGRRPVGGMLMGVYAGGAAQTATLLRCPCVRRPPTCLQRVPGHEVQGRSRRIGPGMAGVPRGETLQYVPLPADHASRRPPAQGHVHEHPTAKVLDGQCPTHWLTAGWATSAVLPRQFGNGSLHNPCTADTASAAAAAYLVAGRNHEGRRLCSCRAVWSPALEACPTGCGGR